MPSPAATTARTVTAFATSCPCPEPTLVEMSSGPECLGCGAPWSPVDNDGGQVDDLAGLTPAQDLVLEVLVARHRLEDTPYHLEARHRPALKALADRGLVGFDSGIVERTLKAWLTPAGVAAAVSETHVPPALSPTCRSFYIGELSLGRRVDCTRRNHHGGRHRAAWPLPAPDQRANCELRWTDAEAFGRA